MHRRLPACLVLFFTVILATGQEPETPTSPAKVAAEIDNTTRVSPELRKAIEKLELPGVKINLDKWSVDVDGRVCLQEGLLELIVCTKDTKEHESIIVVDAKALHIHTALLLLGANPGNPASHQPINEEMTRFRHLMPSGAPIEVFLVIKDEDGKETQHPISDFIVPADSEDQHFGAPENPDQEKAKEFSTHTFLFAGSMLVGEGEEPRRYLSDLSGNVISITTFGDELLCLPGIHDHSNGALMWQANGEKLPAIDTKVILRLSPVKTPEPPVEK